MQNNITNDPEIESIFGFGTLCQGMDDSIIIELKKSALPPSKRRKRKEPITLIKSEDPQTAKKLPEESPRETFSDLSSLQNLSCYGDGSNLCGTIVS